MRLEMLLEEIENARKTTVSDGYDMSFGELINVYREGEIYIAPIYQRLFRWDSTRKTRFIESILIGIPIPPIFVYQNKEGKWELIDGLQRVSTLLEFAGELKDADGKIIPPLSLEGTRFLPSLAGKKWAPSNPDDEDHIGTSIQLAIKRARIRVEILLPESDQTAKYELFQRLNTGGANLSEQEVRNCVAVMLSEDFYKWLESLSKNTHFQQTIALTQRERDRRTDMEYALRFLAQRNVPFPKGSDVNEYLDEALIELSRKDAGFLQKEKEVFERTFNLLAEAVGDNAFRRWEHGEPKGPSLISLFEVITTGLSWTFKNYEEMPKVERIEKLKSILQEISGNAIYQKFSGAGVRGSTRLENLLPVAKDFFEDAKNTNS